MRAAYLDHRLVGGVDRVGLGESAQDRLGGGGAGSDRGGVSDHLVVLLGDDVPANGPVHHGRRQPRVGVGFAGERPVQPNLVDPFDAGQQVESEQPGQPEPDLGLALGVNVIAFDLHGGAVPNRAVDHRGDFGCGAGDQLRVDGHRFAFDVPVDEHAAAAVAGVPLA